MARPGARGLGPGMGLKYDNCVAGRAGPGLDIPFAGRVGPGPHNSVCGPGPGRVCTTAAGPGRAWASNHICRPGLGLNVRPVQGPSGRHTATVGNVTISLPENIALLLHPHVDAPWSLVVTSPYVGWHIVSP